MRFPLPLEGNAPAFARSWAIQVLLGVLGRTFDVVPPRVFDLPPARALYAFREFSAACMEEALASPVFAAERREELGRRARKLGEQVRLVLDPRDGELMALVSWLYCAIGIDVDGAAPGKLVFRRCYFSERYTPELCAFMAAFDSGFIGGLCAAGELTFSTRITAGCDCCRATLGRREASLG